MGQAKCGGWESEEWMSLSIVAFYVVGSSSFYIDINHGLMRQVLLTLSSLAMWFVQCDSIRFNKWMHMCFYALSVGTKWKGKATQKILGLVSSLYRLCVCVSYAWIDIHSHRKYCDGHPISFETNVNRLYWNAQHNASDAIRREKPEEIQSP